MDFSHLATEAQINQFTLDVAESESGKTVRMMIQGLGMTAGYIESLPSQVTSQGTDDFLDFVFKRNGNIQTKFRYWERQADGSYLYTIEGFEVETNPHNQLTKRIVPLRLKQLTGLVNGSFPFAEDDTRNRLPQLSQAWKTVFKKGSSTVHKFSLKAIFKEMLPDDKGIALSQHPVAWLASQLHKKAKPESITSMIGYLWKIYRSHETCDTTQWISEGFLTIEQALHWGEQPQNSGRDVYTALKKLSRAGFLEQTMVDGFYYYRPVGLPTLPKISLLGYCVVEFLLGHGPQPMLAKRHLGTITEVIQELARNKVLVPDGPDKRHYHLLPGTWICQAGNHPIAAFEFTIKEKQSRMILDFFKVLAAEFQVCEPYLQVHSAILAREDRQEDTTLRLQTLRQELAYKEDERSAVENQLKELKEQLP